MFNQLDEYVTVFTDYNVHLNIPSYFGSIE